MLVTFSCKYAWSKICTSVLKHLGLKKEESLTKYKSINYKSPAALKKSYLQNPAQFVFHSHSKSFCCTQLLHYNSTSKQNLENSNCSFLAMHFYLFEFLQNSTRSSSIYGRPDGLTAGWALEAWVGLFECLPMYKVCFIKSLSQQECLKEDKSIRKGRKNHPVSDKVRELWCSSLSLTTESWLLLALWVWTCSDTVCTADTSGVAGRKAGRKRREEKWRKRKEQKI